MQSLKKIHAWAQMQVSLFNYRDEFVNKPCLPETYNSTNSLAPDERYFLIMFYNVCHVERVVCYVVLALKQA